MAEWWVNNSKQNMLTGIPGDPDNPAKLPDGMISQHLRRIPAARESFLRILPTLTTAEQERLGLLSKYAFANPIQDPSTASDNLQRSQNTVGIHTTGRRGGGPFYG